MFIWAGFITSFFCIIAYYLRGNLCAVQNRIVFIDDISRYIRDLRGLQGGGAGGVRGVEWGLSRWVGVRILSPESLKDAEENSGGLGGSVGFYISTKTDCRTPQLWAVLIILRRCRFLKVNSKKVTATRHTGRVIINYSLRSPYVGSSLYTTFRVRGKPSIKGSKTWISDRLLTRLRAT